MRESCKGLWCPRRTRGWSVAAGPPRARASNQRRREAMHQRLRRVRQVEEYEQEGEHGRVCIGGMVAHVWIGWWCRLDSPRLNPHASGTRCGSGGRRRLHRAGGWMEGRRWAIGASSRWSSWPEERRCACESAACSLLANQAELEPAASECTRFRPTTQYDRWHLRRSFTDVQQPIGVC